MLELISEKCAKALNNGNKLVFCGNGGSAELSNHIVAEFVGRYSKDRRALNAISLCSNISVITSIANDYSFDEIFSRQVEAHCNSGDILFCISTSGNSKNVLLANIKAQEMGVITVALTGDFKTALNESANYKIMVNETKTPKIQEKQLEVLHKLVENVENIACLDK